MRGSLTQAASSYDPASNATMETDVSQTHPTSASHRRLLRALGLAAGAAATAACVSTSAPPRPLASGEQVYHRVCVACHATGVERAPRLGDRVAWKPLIEEGQDVLTAHAWVGVRGMPPRGGDATLGLEEFARATAFMARAAGGDWKDPDARMLHRIGEEIAERVRSLDRKK